jgi:hypothetical protein
VGLVLHRAIERVPDAMADLWALALQVIRKRLGLG